MSVLVYKINGVDVSEFVEKRSVAVTNALTQRVDSARIRFVGDHNDIQPESPQKLEVFDGAAKVFGGLIATVSRSNVKRDIDIFQVTTQDFTKLLQKRLVTRVFDSPTTAGDIFKIIVTEFVEDPSVTVVNVQDGPTIEFISFNFKRVDQVFTELARITGFEWYIDEDKDIHFFTPTTTPAPAVINAANFDYKNFKIKAIGTQLRTRITVRGGKTESDPFTQTIVGDDEALEFPVAYKPASLTAQVDTGSGFASVTIGVDNVDDEASFDFVVNADEKLIRNGTHAKLRKDRGDGTPDRLKLTYTFEVPVIVQVEDAAAIANLAAIEESDGIYEFIVIDDNIVDLETARLRGKAEITKFGDVQFNGSFQTHTAGFRSGQLLTVDFPSRGLNAAGFLIQNVKLASLGDGLAEYTIKFGSFSFALEDLLIGLVELGKKIELREGEVLDDLILVSEAIPIVDAAPTLTDATPPFTWGVGPNDTTWNFGEWA